MAREQTPFEQRIEVPAGYGSEVPLADLRPGRGYALPWAEVEARLAELHVFVLVQEDHTRTWVDRYDLALGTARLLLAQAEKEAERG